MVAMRDARHAACPSQGMNTPTPAPPDPTKAPDPTVQPVPDPAGPVDRDWKRHDASQPIEGEPEPADESAVESLGRAVVEPLIGAPAPPPGAAPPAEENSAPPRSGTAP